MTAEDFWTKVKTKLSEQGETFVWLCEQAGVSVQIMKNRIYKKRIPDVNETLKLLSVLGVSVEEFFGAQDLFLKKAPYSISGFAAAVPVSDSNPDFISENSSTGEKIPVYNRIPSHCSEQSDSDPENIDGYIVIPGELRDKRYLGHLAASKVRGDSMEPTIFNGDTIVFDNAGYQEDGIYAVVYQGKGAIKRIQSISDGMKIISDNPTYESTCAEDGSGALKVVGKVLYVIHRL